jgi:dienelactone hydrolase
MIRFIPIFLLSTCYLLSRDTFTPISDPGKIANTAVGLWASYDPRAESLDVKVIKEWKTERVTTRYITYKVGRFKGVDSRVAAYYSFPNKPGKHPAFVWTHGGGQRAERSRSIHFAEQGFACIDVNWLGRPMEKDITIHTDWGKVDPTQGPKFYTKALRKGWKRSMQPDEYTIDPIPSPRNSNWFLLAVAARRAITFLEQQPEVKTDRIGFSGFSMGGMITALSSTDQRLQAVAPFVGGTGFKYIDFPGGITGSSIRPHFKDLEMYKNTIDPQAYWPHVKCPVAFITSTNDFHSTFERIYRSMDLLPHKQWRVSSNVHHNHGPGPEQWSLLTLWFKKYLADEDLTIPETPPSTFEIKNEWATFAVSPKSIEQLMDVEIYYSYDPNSRTRFWERAPAQKAKNRWETRIKVYPELPLYVFAHCRYKLGEAMPLQNGEAQAFSINSKEVIYEPQNLDLKAFTRLPKSGLLDDFSQGITHWSSRNGDSISTYKFQSPLLDCSGDKVLAFTIDPQGRPHTLRLRTGSGFLSREKNQGNFMYNAKVTGNGPQQILVKKSDFKPEKDESKKLEWSSIATFSVTLVDLESKKSVRLAEPEAHRILQKIELVDQP